MVLLASGGLHQGVVTVDRLVLKNIASALSNIAPRTQLGGTTEDIDRATMSTIYFLWSRAANFEKEIEPILAGCWAGQVLRRMQAHFATVQATRRIHAEMNDPRRVQERRAQRKKERQDRHIDRLAHKRQWDKGWQSEGNK